LIIDELILHNFGVYAGRQRVKLAPRSPEKPIILLGGLNGGGKTTLLDAIQLALFGPKANISNRNGTRYQDYLKSCVNTSAKQKEASVQLSFRHTIEGSEDEYSLYRSWRVTTGGCKESFEVIRNGKFDATITENWLSQVEDFFPEKIAHLFLFDGEKIEGYADPEKSVALIETAIQNLLGLDIVDQLEKDLKILERRKQTEQGSEGFKVEIKLAEIEQKETRIKIRDIKQERGDLGNRLDRKRKELAEVEDHFRKLGGELYDRRHELEEKLISVAQDLKHKNSELVELASGTLPFRLVSGLLDTVAARDEAEGNERLTRHVLDILSTRDKILLDLLSRQKVSQKAQDAVAIHLRNDRYKRASTSQVPPILELTPNARADLHALRTKEMVKVTKRATNLLQDQFQLKNEVELLQLEFASIPSDDIIDPFIEKRNKCSIELKSLEKEYDVRGGEIERLEREFVRQTQKLKRLLQRDIESTIRSEDQKRVLIHSSRVRHTMSRFRQAMIVRHVHRIEQFVLESFLILLRKGNLVSKLSIDPKTFQLTLIDFEGRQLPQEKLSAGERQLLAVSLLWGLAKASGRPLPAAIDTPLSRLDTTHRSHVVERYFPYASHQVILLSTNEEIYGQYLEKLKPWIGRSYYLEYDESKSSTVIKKGYFD